MPIIKQLPPHEAQKIAAGEVVERPANVVKELIENALDAGATALTIYLEEGGKKLIRVIDNGSGMSPEDAHLCILHHATSKIKTIHDLEQLRTFGFRGEALSSISSVSKMSLKTKEAASSLGIELEIEEGTTVKEASVAMNTGTDIAIRDLFYCVPARQKFLKTKETEWRTIVHLFHALCLSYQQVSFTLYHDDRLIFTVAATDSLKERISQLFEPALTKSVLLLDAHEERMNLTIKGAITHQYTRFDRTHLYMFVNNRWVKNHKLGQALIRGFQNMLQPNRYPAGFLFITLDAPFVDINIHPRKEEVQFLHPRIIEELIQTTVQKTLESTMTLGRTVKENVQANILPRPVVQEKIFHKQFNNAAAQPPEARSSSEKEEKDFLNALATFTPAHQEKTTETQTPLFTTSKPPLHYRLIGQFQLTYLVIESEEGLVLIDQHAAHERVIFERIKVSFDEITQVRLLFPQVISLTRSDVSLIEPYLELFQSFGIEAQRMSEQELVIVQTPIFLKNQSLEDCVKQAIGALHEYSYLGADELKKIMVERIHAQLSCKAAVKAGDELSMESMHQIIKDLHSTNNKLTCPHGRPTQWALTKSDIEKKFKRDYR